MLKLCVEGWRNINHSYAIVNQKQLIELSKFQIDIKHLDVPFYNKNWNIKKNFNGFLETDNKIIENFLPPKLEEKFDITYRISYPYNFGISNSNKLFVFGTAEFQNIDNHYINGNIEEKNKLENFNIITPSKWSKEGFVKAGFKSEKVHIVPHGVDQNTFYPIDKNEIKKIKKKLGINSETFTILSVGAMTENKGTDYLLAAFFILKQKYKDIKLILKDQSNLYNIKPQVYLDKLKNSKYNKFIKENFVKDIIFVSQNMSLKMLNEIYNISDCYVSSYRAEGFGITPLEAAATGTPIIVTKGGSTDDYFNSKLGLQIESQIIKNDKFTSLRPSVDSLVSCIISIMDNREFFDHIEGLKYIRDKFTWKKVSEKLYGIF